MHHNDQTSPEVPIQGEAAELVLGMARRLHKVAKSAFLAQSLPVLRRILAAEALHGISLPLLWRNRSMVQRKHILRTLAVEAGFPSWEAYRLALSNMTASDLEHFDLIRPAAGYPNLWFSTPALAAQHAGLHGGHAIRVGSQGVVIPVDAAAIGRRDA